MPWPLTQLLAVHLALASGKRGAACKGLVPPGITTGSPVIFRKHAPSSRGTVVCHHNGTETHDDPPHPHWAPLGLGRSAPGSWDPIIH